MLEPSPIVHEVHNNDVSPLTTPVVACLLLVARNGSCLLLVACCYPKLPQACPSYVHQTAKATMVPCSRSAPTATRDVITASTQWKRGVDYFTPLVVLHTLSAQIQTSTQPATSNQQRNKTASKHFKIIMPRDGMPWPENLGVGGPFIALPSPFVLFLDACT